MNFIFRVQVVYDIHVQQVTRQTLDGDSCLKHIQLIGALQFVNHGKFNCEMVKRLTYLRNECQDCDDCDERRPHCDAGFEHRIVAIQQGINTNL